MIKFKKNYSWKINENIFCKERIVNLPIENFKKCIEELPYEMTNKEEQVFDIVLRDQARTLLYTLEILLEKFGYVERVGNLKFENVDKAKDYCFGILKGENTWRRGFILYGDNMGKEGLPASQFPYQGEDFEEMFWNEGIIDAYSLSKDNLINGILVDRKTVWNAIHTIYERNKCILIWKLTRGIIKNRIKEI